MNASHEVDGHVNFGIVDDRRDLIGDGALGQLDSAGFRQVADDRPPKFEGASGPPGEACGVFRQNAGDTGPHGSHANNANSDGFGRWGRGRGHERGETRG